MNKILFIKYCKVGKLCCFILFFQIQLGEELLAAGDMEAGVEHLGQAVAVCGQTQQLLSVCIYVF